MRCLDGLVLTVLFGGAALSAPPKQFVLPGADRRLTYASDTRGNRVPDFSFAGYGGGATVLDVPVRVVVPATKGDSTARVQAAIDHVAGLKPDANGFRGAVLLLAGRHEIGGHLRFSASGIVLRGQGKETVLVATGTDRRAVIQVRGKVDRVSDKARAITDKYVPVGANLLRLDSTDGLKIGDAVQIEHPSTKDWIASVGMDRFPSRDTGSYLDWKPGTLDLRWERVVTKIDGNTITLDTPMTSSLDVAHTRCTVRSYTWPGRVRSIGVENLRLESTYDKSNPRDEDHAWTGITVENAEDVWVRQVAFAHLAGSAVAVWESSRRVTVEDCTSTNPISELGGYRRHTFFTAGQQTLFLRCTTDDGRHDFAVGHLAAGPNAFVQCKATNAHRFSGPIGSWASGVLYDNVNIDGAGLALTNRETDDAGAGWCATNSMLWQCTAPLVTCRMPPTAQNWAVGVWGQFVGDGHWAQLNEFAKPDSLFEAQLADRLGANKAGAVLKRRAIPIDMNDAKSIDELIPKLASPTVVELHPLKLTNGWLAIDGRVFTGNRLGTAWWRGSVLPTRATEVGAGVTRFVPGRVGPGFTDDLDQLTDEMKANGFAILDHHWGLWYDRRRDDHQMVRRIDGDAWAPFYEQPWARCGRGTAWDGLSKYDLTKFNPWYFARLKEFASHAERKGLVLVQQMYFQHNVLEAGAHWADFAWRPANCVQATGFPEPPEYAGNKRVFMAEPFYDVEHPVRRDLHRRYIRHCLDTLGDSPNVVFQIGEEFTGPLHFVQFWIDTVGEWQKDTGKKVHFGLSCTKDVQEAILADAKRAALVSVIDIKYWWYTSDGGTYDPKSGQNLAPRQQLREWKGNKSRSDESVSRAVREYRAKFPDKAVTVSFDGANGWAVLAAGGSVPRLPPETDTKLLAAVTRLKPLEAKSLPKGAMAVADSGREYLVWAPTGGAIAIDLSTHTETFTVNWINPKSGKATEAAAVRGGNTVELRPPTNGPAVLWLARK